MPAPRCYWFPPVPHPEAGPPDLTSLLHTLLLEQTSQCSELRVRLDDALDGREAAEERAGRAERQYRKLRELVREDGSGYDHPDEPPEPWREMRDLRVRLDNTLDAERRAFRTAEHQRDRALAAERRCDELKDEIGRLRAHLDF